MLTIFNRELIWTTRNVEELSQVRAALRTAGVESLIRTEHPKGGVANAADAARITGVANLGGDRKPVYRLYVARAQAEQGRQVLKQALRERR